MTAKSRVALFIDAENASDKLLPHFLELCRKLGKPTIARCYGGVAGLKKWEEAIAEYHLTPMLTPPGAVKENASDFALTIDAVSLLHRDLYDHAVIASSDADFTQLAIHIREHGKGIDGIGESKATRSMRSAFDNFTEVPAVKLVSTPKKTVQLVTRTPDAPGIDHAWLRKIFDGIKISDSFVGLQSFGLALKKANPDYKKGYRTLDNYLKKSRLQTHKSEATI
jgi:hypothetical protein